MIKAIGLLQRKEGMTHEQFMQHWTEVHAPMAHKLKRVRRYVLNFIVGEPTRPDIPMLSEFGQIDGIAEVWYESRETYEAHKASPEGKEWHADGAKFIGRTKSFLIEEKVIIANREDK